MGFSFNFSGDDIDERNDADMLDHGSGNAADHEDEKNSSAVRAKIEDLSALLSTLPSQISYSNVSFVSPRHKRHATIPRRELFDVKMQLMAEEGDEHEDKQAKDHDTNAISPETSGLDKHKTLSGTSGLGDSDIEQNVYEGGFKSWEGAKDLAQLLLDRVVGNDPSTTPHSLEGNNILELGCGTALPSLVLFQHALGLTSNGARPLRTTFTLADYNESVIRLVTLPNLLLTWALHPSNSAFHQSAASAYSPSSSSSSSSSSESESESPKADCYPSTNPEEGDLAITPTLLDAFITDLAKRGISITLVSGSWAATTQFQSLLPSPSHLVLASETIYSPSSLKTFTQTLLAILASNKLHTDESGRREAVAVALVAAKRVYFGVGGGVEEFMALVRQSSSSECSFVVREILGSGIVGCDVDARSFGGGGAVSGVSRWLGEVFVS